MTRSNPLRTVLSLAAAAGLAMSLGGSCFAQPPQGQRPADPLQGPSVRDRDVPGVNGTFGEPGGDKKRFVNENRLPPKVFREAMETILNPEAPENLRVTDEQRTRYRTWMDDFQKSVGAYMKEHAAELGELRKKAGDFGQGRRPGGPGGQGLQWGQGGRGGQGQPGQPNPPMDDGAKPPVDEKETVAAREQLQGLMQGAPKIEDLYTKIWSELNPDQQKAVDERLQEFRSRQAKEREDRYVQQKLGKKKGPGAPPPDGQNQPQPGDQNFAPRRPGGPDGQNQPRPLGDQNFPQRRPGDQGPRPEGSPQPGGPDSGPRGDFAERGPQMDPQRRDRLMRLFSRLSPDQQDQLLQRLEQRMRERAGDAPPGPNGRPGRGGPQGPAEPRPAPRPDDSMMPPAPGEPAPGE